MCMSYCNAGLAYVRSVRELRAHLAPLLLLSPPPARAAQLQLETAGGLTLALWKQMRPADAVRADYELESKASPPASLSLSAFSIDRWRLGPAYVRFRCAPPSFAHSLERRWLLFSRVRRA